MGHEESIVARNGRIDFSNRNLTMVDDELVLPDSVLHVDLSNNKVISIPPAKSVVSLSLMSNSYDKLQDKIIRALIASSKLENLDLSRNNLTELPSSVTTIQTLHCLNLFGNEFTGLDLTDSHIKEIDLGANKLSELPVLGDSVITAALDFNRIASINRSYASLKTLCLSGNVIESFVDDICFPELEVLDLSRNTLKSLPDLRKVTPKLITLDISRNCIGAMSGIPKTLQRFDASWNRFTEFPDFEGLLFIVKVDLSFNYISTVPVLPVSIQILNLTGNYITEMADSDTPDLMSVSLMQNKLQVIPNLNCNRVSELSFYGNRLKSIRVNHLFGGLCVLDLSNNEIEEVPGDVFGLPNLFSLNLSCNKIKRIPVQACSASVINLNLSQNPLECFPEYLPMPLENLQIAECNLTAIDDSLADSLDLIEINAAGNKLTEFPPVPQLMHVNLSCNCFTKFPFLSENIVSVDLSYNKISELHSEFSYPDMVKLDLSCNCIQNIPSDICLPSLEYLYLQGNLISGKIQLKTLEALQLVDITGMDVSVSTKRSPKVISSRKASNSSSICMNTGPGVAYAMHSPEPLEQDLVMINSKDQVFAVANANNKTANESIIKLVSSLTKKKRANTEEVINKIVELMNQKMNIVPSLLCCVLFTGDEFITARYGPIDLCMYSSEGTQLFTMKDGSPLLVAPDFAMGHCRFPNLDKTSASSAVHGNISANKDDEISLISIQVNPSAKWIIITSSICSKIIPQSMIEEITKLEDEREIAYRIRNLVYSTGYKDNITVVVINVNNL